MTVLKFLILWCVEFLAAMSRVVCEETLQSNTGINQKMLSVIYLNSCVAFAVGIFV